MVGTKADIAAIFMAGLCDDAPAQPTATHFQIADVVEVIGMMIAAIADVAGTEAAEPVALAALAGLEEIAKR